MSAVDQWFANVECCRFALTDIVIKTKQLACEFFYMLANQIAVTQSVSPLPPFIMTQICEPTHLSMSSV